MVESWEDPLDRDDEDEQLEPWQEAARPVDAPHVPAAYGSCEPSACELLRRSGDRIGAETGRHEYAALGRYLETRGRIQGRWPRPCADCGGEVRGPRPLVRGVRCRGRRRARPRGGARC